VSDRDNDSGRPARPMAEAQANMTEIVMPNDANPHGSVSGGRVLHLIDICAAVAAVRHARRPVVTASFDDVAFMAPVPVGHIITLDAQVTGVGDTSMEVRVDVHGENPVTGDRRHTTTAYTTFVALDDARNAFAELEEAARRADARRPGLVDPDDRHGDPR